jgi:hypothetical protein
MWGLKKLNGNVALPLIRLPAPSPRKDGEKFDPLDGFISHPPQPAAHPYQTRAAAPGRA